eukprot:364891-Chlamydomonas_euryale.AAC.3
MQEVGLPDCFGGSSCKIHTSAPQPERRGGWACREKEMEGRRDFATAPTDRGPPHSKRRHGT